jgi:hypothetical protein
VAAGTPPITTDGKFLRLHGQRRMLAMVTYGPLPGGWPDDCTAEFRRIRAAGFDGIRLYELPGPGLLDSAKGAGLVVLAGLRWPCATDFHGRPGTLTAARVALADWLGRWGGHPAVAGVLVANEVPADLARWIGPVRVRAALEDLIRLGHELRPGRLFAYGNFPSTEYLEPGNADITAMNIFLEDEPAFRRYLRRLQHIAGDRPVVVSEFGLDSRRHGTAAQAGTLRWAIRAARAAGVAALTVYAWTDRWWNAGAEVTDWDFGLTDRSGRAKPALQAVADELAAVRPEDRGALAGAAPGGRRRRETRDPAPGAPLFSVIVCTRNGVRRIGRCLAAIRWLDHPAFEVIVVDDGSQDDTGDLVRKLFAEARLVRQAPAGLSAARNAGAAAARGAVLAFTDDDCRPDPAWLTRLEEELQAGDWDAVGGPNLPPPPVTAAQAVVAAAPGAPSHVMLDDLEAEHVPGCNLAVTRAAFLKVGGFDPRFTTAGDDVDFCWRLRDAGLRIGFSPTAVVWHERRPDAVAYLCQQAGYGRAEALLCDKFPHRFGRAGGACWCGRIYEGGAIRAGCDAVIYHGLLGAAGYQSVVDRMLPRRPIDDRFFGARARFELRWLERLQPWVRGGARRWFRRTAGTADAKPSPPAAPMAVPEAITELALWSPAGRDRQWLLERLLAGGWQPAGAHAGWDLVRGDCRLLAATEPGDEAGRLTRVRIGGSARAVAAAAGEVGALGLEVVPGSK